MRVVNMVLSGGCTQASSGSVRMVENSDPGQHFQASRGHSISSYGPTPSRQITFLFFSCSKLAFAADYKLKFRAKCKVLLQNNFGQSLPLKSLEIRFLYRKLNSRKRGNSLSVFHRNCPKYSNDQR